MSDRRYHIKQSDDDEFYLEEYSEPTIGFVLPLTAEPAEPTRCEDHRKYQAKRKPRTACEACWRMFIARNP